MSEAFSFNVTTRHLSPDGRTAGSSFGEVRLTGLGRRELRSMLEALAAVAPTVEYPTAPEMRITSGDQQFLIQVRDGRLRYSSWAVRAGGCDLPPAQILEAITGREDEPVAKASPVVVAAAPRAPATEGRRTGMLAVLVAGVVIANVVTAVMLFSPEPALPAELLPEHQVLDPQAGRRHFERAVGTYETGRQEGDRRLIVRRDGTVLWARYGPKQAVLEELPLTAQAAESRGRPAFLTSQGVLIEVRDPLTLVYMGDTYRRVLP